MGVGSADFLSWGELKPYLIDLNTCSGLNLLVCLAACSGANLVKVVRPTDRAPVWGIVGPKRPISADELLHDYSAFYTELIRSLDGRLALEALNGGPPSADWRYAFVPAERFFHHVFREYLKSHTTPEAVSARVDWIVDEVRLGRKLSPKMEARLRADARRRLEDQRPFFDSFKNRFFMIDKFPQNVHRFPITFDDIQQFDV